MDFVSDENNIKVLGLMAGLNLQYLYKNKIVFILYYYLHKEVIEHFTTF